jgi:hypothetical protein
LVFSLVPLVLFFATVHLAVVGGSAAGMTPAQVDERAVPWVGAAVLWVLPVVLAAVAFAAIAGRLGHRAWVKPLAVAGVALLASHVAAWTAVLWLDRGATLADSPVYALAIVLSLLGWWAVSGAAVLTCLALSRSRVLPRAARVVGILTLLCLALEIAVYLPALVGTQELHETVGLPPMVLPLLWAILGGLLWRKRS